MKSKISFKTRTPEVIQLHELLKQTDWAHKRSRENLIYMCKHSHCVCAFIDNNLVGFARAITDYQYRALIEDVVVDKSYRSQQIGTKLMRHLCNDLMNIEEIILGCIEQNIGYYEKLGFEKVGTVYMRRR